METNTVSIGDMKVRVAGSGPALVFCHGFTTTSRFWREQVDVFGTSHMLVMPDLPGHGESSARFNMLMGKGEAAARRAWIEEHGNEAEADI